MIRLNGKLDLAIENYYNITTKIYQTSPLYFKVMSKANRIIIFLAILGGYYTLENPCFREVKKLCINNDLLSTNALDSFISFLCVGGRLELSRNEQDKRKLTYRPTAKGLNEVYELISSLLLPYRIIYPEFDLADRLSHDDFMVVFFKNHSQVILNEIFIYDAVPDCREFVTRDGGHMIMFNLYIESVRQKTLAVKYNYLKASTEFSVSRSHIKRCFLAAEHLGLLHLKQDGKTIELTPRFIEMVKDSFCFYLATVEYGVLGAQSTAAIKKAL
ncbi:hypothetical protein [Serratia fonticola]|uniref:MarR family transcriptional regulator n=1 Tax=Serratia fonticola TaxID=47917 RepID=A0ABY9PRS8_SERFO|nr:hypothetical protein [Serratia fonticola]WMT15818.1 hypothetical protein RFB13_05680 [Serratia fonticola]